MILKVEPLTTARALRGPFDYLRPAAMEGVGIGSVLEVPFGTRRMLGVVVETAEGSDVAPEKLVEPLSALEHGVPAELVRLGLWVAEEYCSTPARGLALVLPPGTGTGKGRRTRARKVLAARLTGAGKDVLRAPSPPRLGERQREALGMLGDGPTPAATVPGGHATLRSLEKRGLVTLAEVEVRRRPESVAVGAREKAGTVLTAGQSAALARIEELYDAGEEQDRRVLLHGVTGSGKTEVYLRAAASALARGQSAIVLVPEIALTPQTAGRFRERFGEQVAILHSQLAAGERYDEWLRMRRGQARVCVGPRSAVFAPLERLGLLVIDEEHDASYKQEGDPRYDARHVAERRARDAGAVLVAGTATPRPESWERLPRVSLPERVDGQGMPRVEIVSAIEAGGSLHERTLAALGEVREREEKAVVLLNRRGWSNFLSCRTCGRVWECPNCDVSLVLHRGQGRMACHHCGHSEQVPRACPDCGSVSVARHGAGTERLERELIDVVAPLPVFRLDSDTAGAKHAITNLLRRFDQAPSGVLVGTQMVAKGHDFPDVTLGVVLDADATLRFPDFRSEERTFAMVAQLAGRAGRGRGGGRVVVQAADPSARSLAHAAQHDATGFLGGELERRAALRYPPFGELVRIVCASEDPAAPLEAAAALKERIEGTVLGPAPLFRLKGRDRALVLVKSSDRAASVASVRAAVEATASEWSKRGVSFSVDVDPQ